MRRWLWPRSLAARVVLAQGLAILLVAIALPFAGSWILHHLAVGEQQRVQEEQAAAIAHGLSMARGRDGSVTVTLQDGLQHAFDSRYDGRGFVVVGEASGPVAISRYGDAIPWERVPLDTRLRSFVLTPFAGVSLPVGVGGRRFWVIVAQDSSGPGVVVNRVVEHALGRFAAIMLPMLLVFAILNYFLVRGLTVSVERMSATAARIGPDSLDIRLAEGRMPSEVAPLVRAVNELVARLGESLNGQAQFVGNVVHELRTPLSTLKMQADAVADPGLRARIEAQVDRLGHVIAQLRDLASLEAPGPAGTVDLAAVATEVVAEWAPRAMETGHAIALDGADRALPVAGNATLVALAATNLVSNAIRHTPAGTAIRVSVTPARLMVEDDGPGVVQFEPDSLTRRFWRADHRRSDSAGLGLAIVRRIMETVGGRIEIGAADGGGARFTLVFPEEAAQ